MTPTWFSAGLDHVPDDDYWMDPALVDRLAGMRYAKRRSETRLNRWTAKCAVAEAVGIDSSRHAELRRIVVANARDGAPEVYVDAAPAPINVALTDRADWAVCAVAGLPVSVGCDLEVVEPRSAAFVADYLTDLEQDWVGSHPEPDLASNLVWSAKESALKVLRTGLRRPTKSVEVQPSDGPDGAWTPLTVRTDMQTFAGWWVRYRSFVLTVVTSAETPRPRSLQHPPHLAAATPTHRWMHDVEAV